VGARHPVTLADLADATLPLKEVIAAVAVKPARFDAAVLESRALTRKGKDRFAPVFPVVPFPVD
jgi:hypothetical protein